MRSTDPSPLTEAHIFTALRDCYDPEIRANIIDLGLIHSIAVTSDPDAPGAGIPGVPPRYSVHIGLMPPDPGSDIEAQIVALIENRLAAFPNISRTRVDLIAEPRWTPDRVAPELRQRLSLAIASNQRHHALVQIQTASPKPRERS